jgi:hypothetical protein
MVTFYAMYTGPQPLMKASQEQKDAATQNQQFTTQLQQQFNTAFATSQATNQQFMNQINGILTKANAGQGFTDAELASLNTSNTEQNAGATANAQAAVDRQNLQQGGGAALPSGAQDQLRAQVAATGAANQAAGARQIALNNAQQAQSNMQFGTSALGTLAGQQSSQANAVGGLAVNNGANSYNEVTQAFQPSNFFGNLAQGVIGGVGTAVAGPLGGALSSSILGGGGNPTSSTSTSYGGANGTGESPLNF